MPLPRWPLRIADHNLAAVFQRPDRIIAEAAWLARPAQQTAQPQRLTIRNQASRQIPMYTLSHIMSLFPANCSAPTNSRLCGKIIPPACQTSIGAKGCTRMPVCWSLGGLPRAQPSDEFLSEGGLFARQTPPVSVSVACQRSTALVQASSHCSRFWSICSGGRLSGCSGTCANCLNTSGRAASDSTG